MILLRKAIEPILEELGIEGYHIGGTSLISLVSKCGEPILIFSDFAIKNSFTRAERDFIADKLEQTLTENVSTIANIESAREELKTIKIDIRINDNYKYLRYMPVKDLTLTLQEKGKFVLHVSSIEVDAFFHLAKTFEHIMPLMVEEQKKIDRIDVLKNIIDQGKTCSI